MTRCPHCQRSDTTLLTITDIQRDLNVSKYEAEAIFRRLPKIKNPGGRRRGRDYVRSADVEWLMKQSTVAA